MFLVNYRTYSQNLTASPVNYPNLGNLNPISIEDLKKKSPEELIFTSDAIDYLNNTLYLTIECGEWKDINTEPF